MIYQVRGQLERWDLIAYAAYGNAYLWADIAKANPQYLGQLFLPVGAVIQVPDIAEITRVINPTLPDWRLQLYAQNS